MRKALHKPTYLDALTAVASAVRDGAWERSIIEVPFSRNGFISYVINSRILKRPMLIEVALPETYNNISEQKQYPVMYMTDSIRDMDMFDHTGISTNNSRMDQNNNKKEIILVGIDFISSIEDYEGFRLNYYTPTESNSRTMGLIGGKAGLFLRFIEQEVKPLINDTYNTDIHNQTLTGHLLGGLFSLYGLFTRPELFNNYIVSSPLISWGNSIIRIYEEYLSKLRQSLQKNVYISSGSMDQNYEGVSENAMNFAGLIERRNYSGLCLKREVHLGENNNSAIVRSYATGARFVYDETIRSKKAS